MSDTDAGRWPRLIHSEEEAATAGSVSGALAEGRASNLGLVSACSPSSSGYWRTGEGNMLEKTERVITVNAVYRCPLRVVREHYLRPCVPCNSALCSQPEYCCNGQRRSPRAGRAGGGRRGARGAGRARQGREAEREAPAAAPRRERPRPAGAGALLARSSLTTPRCLVETPEGEPGARSSGPRAPAACLFPCAGRCDPAAGRAGAASPTQRQRRRAACPLHSADAAHLAVGENPLHGRAREPGWRGGGSGAKLVWSCARQTLPSGVLQ